MRLWSWLFGWNRDDRERRAGDTERKISPAMPMAAAGAELSAQPDKSETEESLKRAANNDHGQQ